MFKMKSYTSAYVPSYHIEGPPFYLSGNTKYIQSHFTRYPVYLLYHASCVSKQKSFIMHDTVMH